ncbi:hypothetical protein SAMN05446935_8218 [Burkholderia sp. YR290]|nr:hypothetical protein SAMN05446935_8218 [Burkholderia sp. YR290]
MGNPSVVAKTIVASVQPATDSVGVLIGLNSYHQLRQNPVASLVRSTDERPDVADVVVLGYN